MIFCTIFFLACLSSIQSKTVFFDTDFGVDVDDALALFQIVTNPDLVLVGVQTSGKYPIRGAKMVKKFLNLLGRPNVPVHVGVNHTSEGGDYLLDFGNEGLGVLSTSAEQDDSNLDVLDISFDVPDYSTADVIVAVGPHTNIARNVEKHGAKIKELAIMGGSVLNDVYHDIAFEEGLFGDVNLRMDPQAAQVTLLAAEKVDMVPGNVTLHCYLTPSDLEKIAEHAAMLKYRGENNALWLLFKSILYWSPIQHTVLSKYGFTTTDNVAFLHDPMAVALASSAEVQKRVFTTIEEKVNVELVVTHKNVLQTVVRQTANPHHDMFVARIVDEANCEEFRKYFLELLLGYEYPRMGVEEYKIEL